MPLNQPTHSPVGPPPGSAPSPYDNPTEEFPEARVTVADVDETRSVAEPGGGYEFATIPAARPMAERSRTLVDPGYGRGTLDLGLLVLRLAIGGTFIYLGLDKLTNAFGSGGLDATKGALLHGGWEHARAWAVLLSGAELGGGVLLVLGFLTPVAAAALVAASVDTWLWLQDGQSGWVYDLKTTIPVTVVLGAAAAALVLTGPGRIGLDFSRGWATRPRWGSTALLLAALAGAAASWIVLHGGNPFPV